VPHLFCSTRRPRPPSPWAPHMPTGSQPRYDIFRSPPGSSNLARGALLQTRHDRLPLWIGSSQPADVHAAVARDCCRTKSKRITAALSGTAQAVSGRYIAAGATARRHSRRLLFAPMQSPVSGVRGGVPSKPNRAARPGGAILGVRHPTPTRSGRPDRDVVGRQQQVRIERPGHPKIHDNVRSALLNNSG
jgi:hypothetical protein